MLAGRQFRIAGRVQGVFFRESTRRVAESLGITGHAINLDDGDVEVLAFGESAALDQLADYLRQGPTMANVSNVTGEPVAYEPHDAFVTG
jgi:acylphosphatase